MLPASFAGAATIAPYTANQWSKTWDFATGTQGFTPTVAGGGVAFWNNGAGAGSLQTASTSAANSAFYSFDISTLGPNYANFGGGSSGTKPFVIQADIMPVNNTQ